MSRERNILAEIQKRVQINVRINYDATYLINNIVTESLSEAKREYECNKMHFGKERNMLRTLKCTEKYYGKRGNGTR